MEAELLTIGGVPAHEWVGRRARFWGHENKQHPTPCLIMGIEGSQVTIKPIGHKKTELMSLASILPTWKSNDDLRQKYNIPHNGDGVDRTPQDNAPERTIPEPDSPAPEEVDLTAVSPEDVAPHRVIPRQPRMVVNSHAADWMPVYQEYLELLSLEAADQELLEATKAAVLMHRAQQADLIVKLGVLGVDIFDDVVSPVQQAPAQPKKRLGRIAMDKYIMEWGREMKVKLEAGKDVTGTIGQWHRALNVTHRTVQTRLSLLSKVLKLYFKDEHGKTGDACKGKITVTLK